MITTYGRAVINAEIFDAFGGRSTTAQEVSKSTEVQYTTLQLRESQQPVKRRSGPRGRISSAEFDERSLVNYYTGAGSRVHASSRARARAHHMRFVRKLRIPKVRVSRLVFILLLCRSFLTFFISTGEEVVAGRRKSERHRGLRRRNSGDYGREFIKFFVPRLTTTTSSLVPVNYTRPPRGPRRTFLVPRHPIVSYGETNSTIHDTRIDISVKCETGASRFRAKRTRGRESKRREGASDVENRRREEHRVAGRKRQRKAGRGGDRKRDNDTPRWLVRGMQITGGADVFEPASKPGRGARACVSPMVSVKYLVRARGMATPHAYFTRRRKREEEGRRETTFSSSFSSLVFHHHHWHLPRRHRRHHHHHHRHHRSPPRVPLFPHPPSRPTTSSSTMVTMVTMTIRAITSRVS